MLSSARRRCITLNGALVACVALWLCLDAATGVAATTRTCASFVAFKGKSAGSGTYKYTATKVRRTGEVSCPSVRRMIRSTYGGPGGYKRAYPVDPDTGVRFGRITVYWRGGWRCSNGAGGAGCSNVTHPSWSIRAEVN